MEYNMKHSKLLAEQEVSWRMMENGGNVFMKLRRCRQAMFFAGCLRHCCYSAVLQTLPPYGKAITEKSAATYDIGCRYNLGPK